MELANHEGDERDRAGRHNAREKREDEAVAGKPPRGLEIALSAQLRGEALDDERSAHR